MRLEGLGARRLAALASLAAAACGPSVGSWTAAGPLATARASHTASPLPTGGVLVAGGTDVNGNALASAEWYDPARRRWSAASPLATAREAHSATLLPSGSVLACGGTGGVPSALASCELYDPAKGSWSASAPLATARYAATATLLQTGKVAAVGGLDGSGNGIAAVELFDPASGAAGGGWAGTGDLGTDRGYHSAALLPSGKLLVLGGYNCDGDACGSLDSAEIYDPASGSWDGAGSVGDARYDAAAALLPSGELLVAGGFGTGPGNPLQSAAIYAE